MVIFSEMETPFGKRIFIKKRKIKEQMKIILVKQAKDGDQDGDPIGVPLICL